MRPDILTRFFLFLCLSFRVHIFKIVRHRPFAAHVGAQQTGDVRLDDGGVILIALALQFFLDPAAQRVPAVKAVTEQDADYFPAAFLIALPDDGKKTASVSS